jgi:hypothetical protein
MNYAQINKYFKTVNFNGLDMKVKNKLARKYHFKNLPRPLKITIEEADDSTEKMNGLLSAFRQELSHFNDRQGYRLLGYKNMPAFVKSRIQEISPRYVNGLLKATKVEKSMRLSSPIGTVSYPALMLLRPFSVEIMKKLWNKSLSEMLTGESRVNALKRVILSYKNRKY